jgi:alpha-glucosidase (family GH31 glycosyl hydrolase)
MRPMLVAPRPSPLAVASFVTLAVACGGNPLTFPDYDGAVGNFRVHVDAHAARLTVKDWDGRLLIDGVPGGVGVGRAVAEHDFKFGSFKIGEDARTDVAVAKIKATGQGDGSVALELYDDGDQAVATGSIVPGGEGGLVITVTAKDAAQNRVAFATGCAADERFLGFGGQSYDVDHRGQRVPIWVQEDGIGKNPDDSYQAGDWVLVGRRHSTHTPIPMFVSSRGYGLALDNARRSIWDMCKKAPDALKVEVWDRTLTLRLFGGPAPGDVIRRFTAWTGRPAMPPAFTFAPWLDALYGSANVRRVAKALRDDGIPASVIWTEDWRGGNPEGDAYVLEEDWELDRKTYPDFEVVADELHAAGYKWLTYNNTFLDSTTAETYPQATAGGYTIKDQTGAPYLFNGVKFRPTSLLDLSNPAAVAWAKEKYRAGLVAGADGWMADYGEWLPHDAVLFSGADPTQVHNLYPVAWQRLNHELFADQFAKDGVERLFFVRSAYLGSQPLVSVVWAGDQQTDFSEGDGIKSIVPMGIGLGVTGFPFYSHDIAGYMSQGTTPVSEELWYRWVTLGALSPVMRTHHGRSAAMNWNWEKDSASTAHFKRWASLHIRLYPYFLELTTLALAEGTPIFRPLAIDHPEFLPGWSQVDTFMLGDRIYVAPILDAGATSREVTLPAGVYYPLLGGGAVVVASGQAVVVQAAKEEIPALVPAGAAIALLPEGVMTLVATNPPSTVVGLDDVVGDREVWVWPGGSTKTAELDWNGDGLTGPITSATWNGAAQTVGTGNVIAVTGNGTLVLNGGEATLVVDVPTADQITVRVKGL